MSSRIVLAAAAALVGLGMTNGADRSGAFSYGWNMKPVSATEKWLRVYAEGDGSVDVVAVRGVDFTVTSIKSVRVSGSPTPRCAISGTPPTLRCDGKISGGSSLFLTFGVLLRVPARQGLDGVVLLRFEVKCLGEEVACHNNQAPEGEGKIGSSRRTPESRRRAGARLIAVLRGTLEEPLLGSQSRDARPWVLCRPSPSDVC